MPLPLSSSGRSLDPLNSPSRSPVSLALLLPPWEPLSLSALTGGSFWLERVVGCVCDLGWTLNALLSLAPHIAHRTAHGARHTAHGTRHNAAMGREKHGMRRESPRGRERKREKTRGSEGVLEAKTQSSLGIYSAVRDTITY